MKNSRFSVFHNGRLFILIMKKLSIALTVLMLSAGTLTACSGGSDTLAQADRETQSQWGLTFYNKSEKTDETEAETEKSTESEQDTSSVITEVADGVKMLHMEDVEIQSVSPVNVRSGPGTGHEKVGGLTKEETVIMDGICDNEWVHIRFDDKEGFVSMGFMQALDGNTSLSDLLEQARTAIASGGAAQTGSQEQTQGTEEETVKETGEETSQETDGETQRETTAETGNGSQSNGNTAWATIDVTIRKGPGSNYGALGVLKQDESVKVLDSSDEWWWKVEYNGQEAYISAQYLTTDEP